MFLYSSLTMINMNYQTVYEYDCRRKTIKPFSFKSFAGSPGIVCTLGILCTANTQTNFYFQLNYLSKYIGRCLLEKMNLSVIQKSVIGTESKTLASKGPITIHQKALLVFWLSAVGLRLAKVLINALHFVRPTPAIHEQSKSTVSDYTIFIATQYSIWCEYF